MVALCFAAVHVLGPAMTFLHRTPRSMWLSFAGGISVAYVFVHVLPELSRFQEDFARELAAKGGPLAGLESHSYLLALIGLAVFYGLHRLARSRRKGAPGKPGNGVFTIRIASYAVYSVMIGYLLLHRDEHGLRPLAIYAAAMGLHFVVNDQGLREDHGEAYDRIGRWILAAAPLLGWGMALVYTLPPLAIAALFAFLMGGVVLNVLKEELPDERESRFSAFAGGAAFYAVLLLASA